MQTRNGLALCAFVCGGILVPTNSKAQAPGCADISTTGVITWTPSEAQGPSTRTFTTLVGDNGTPPLTATNSFTITVTEVNRPPTLDRPADRTVNPGETVNFAVTTTDADEPANIFSYALLSGPPGATIHANSGLFHWRPAIADGTLPAPSCSG